MPGLGCVGGGGAFGSLLGGIGGLFGVGGGNPCPCLPKCRKVSHGVASNGVNPLEPQGALIENNSNKYGSDILNNNSTCLAQAAGLSFSGIGASLIPSNILNLTGALTSIPALNDPAGRLEQAIKGGAEQSDLMLEFMYAFEGMEKGFKLADNNISQLEWINHINLVKGLLGYDRIITGKGSRSKNKEDPFKSYDLAILKYSVPNFIKNNLELMKKIKMIDFDSVNSTLKGRFEIT